MIAYTFGVLFFFADGLKHHFVGYACVCCVRQDFFMYRVVLSSYAYTQILKQNKWHNNTTCSTKKAKQYYTKITIKLRNKYVSIA
jgi:hypothetical protein